MSQSTRLIKRRIKSSQNISQITKAMEMVSAAKMKRAQGLAVNSRPYTERMYQVITSLSQKAKSQTEHWLFKDPRQNFDPKNEFKVLIVLFSTDKSLCGGLNTNLFRGLEKWLKNMTIEMNLPPKTSLTFVTVGRKAKDHVLRTGRFLMAEFSTMGDRPHFNDILPLARLISEGFKAGEFQMSFLAYMEFISTISQKLAVKQLLPIIAESAAARPELTFEADYIFEPKANIIFEALLPQYVELQLYHTLLESLASEHSARMVAMKSAHDNAIEVVDQLTLEFNQARQSRITGELLDVITSRMALE
ncbi:ATP synthase F1 subunit gamma [Candidatus Beckwithbacteria bacterium CG22_combo_CG10-13_8_21_14_all_01_47_9]|uniref:ATP synthase gamma chain n=4 Tax=Candidatus Beckwithiibacteriota TaxID=1752726 RepID=A0A2H0E1N9_9BACT|nr:MAG: ATP synthase F1 subunit gamma [Candidatus Beckwithbacteria bacterium CG1_02_47_37]PIP88352.1 MAG: ATP synthase F1 subunit gamma [Candidatus Beckwithbacteria bacterium CG22_combo_CG10-13_8_21_14_all_01_47_9]PJA22938.1 MAG: ATP synthase F1 subunit gamma [Candidatus Beckwithbacteria bacterium CG_4_10_14_0_2_um_filter_47_25]PJC66669.1 MAG: ATP synthase F1 subunit gamma [Candidatus Beckwithbacteria bacterium CG_4_9_14_0_2_um_filter_47_11]